MKRRHSPSENTDGNQSLPEMKPLEIPTTSRNASSIKCGRHSFRVSRSIRKFLSNVKRTSKNERRSLPKCNTSINDRVTQRARPGYEVKGNVIVLSFSQSFLGSRIIKRTGRNITITNKMETRKKQQRHEVDVKIPLADSIEIEDTTDLLNNATEVNPSVPVEDSKENDLLIIEEEKPKNDDVIVVVEDSVVQIGSEEQDCDIIELDNTDLNSNNDDLSRPIVTVSDTSENPVDDPNDNEVIFVGVALPTSSTPKRRKIQQQSFNKNKNANDKVKESNRKLRRGKNTPPSLNLPGSRGNNGSTSENRTVQVAPQLVYFDNNGINRLILNDNIVASICNVGRPRRFGLREIIIDGSNIAFSYTDGRYFSVKALEIAISHFLMMGHQVVTFIPQYRSQVGFSSDPRRLRALQRSGLVVFTPSRVVNGRRITPYDDRYIIQYADAREGIVLSNDNFRDILLEKPEWSNTIENRLLMYTWVKGALMFPEDPLGRYGPNLSEFLKFPDNIIII